MKEIRSRLTLAGGLLSPLQLRPNSTPATALAEVLLNRHQFRNEVVPNVHRDSLVGKAAALRSNENACRVEGKGRNTGTKVVPDAVLDQVLLDVGGIEAGHHRLFFLQVATHSTQRFWPREVAHDRND